MMVIANLKGCQMVKRALGFTLAEVLITLGIIGVVAAMTIPTLIANINGQKYRNQFKKTLSTLSQAARMSDAQYGFDFGGISTVCGANAAKEHPDTTMSICAMMNGTLAGATYFNKVTDIKMSKGNSILGYDAKIPYAANIVTSIANLNNLHAYLLPDGSIFAFSKQLGENPCSLPVGTVMVDVYNGGYLRYCLGFIDVNGATLPNKEVVCSSGENTLTKNNCVVNKKEMTDIYPIRVYDGVVVPATAAGRYVLSTAK